MKTRHTKLIVRSLSTQTGAATLLTSIVILMMATIFVFAVSRTMLMEQRISGNEIRTRQAFEAAEAGLNSALAYLISAPMGSDKKNNTTNATTPDNISDVINEVTLTAGTSHKYNVSFCDPTQAFTGVSCPDAPGAVNCISAPATYLNTPRIVACGWSDDGLARSMVSQGIGTANALAKGPTNSLTAKGVINVQGSATVTNYYNNLTIWTGGSLTNIGNSGKTFIRNPIVPPPAPSVPPPDPNSSASAYVSPTDKNTTGPDVIPNDPTLSTLTDAQFFTNYFGVADLAAYKASIATMPDVTNSTIATLDGVLGQSIVVNGDVTSNMNYGIGSRERPVILIIDGNWTGGGNTIIYGLIYVTGNVIASGNIKVYGAASVEGTVSGTGSLDIIFDPLVISNAENAGKPGLIPGSWRDFN